MLKRTRQRKNKTQEKSDEPPKESEEHTTLSPTCYDWKSVTITRHPTEEEELQDYVERRVYYKHIHFNPFLEELKKVLLSDIGPMVVSFLQYDLPVTLLHITSVIGEGPDSAMPRQKAHLWMRRDFKTGNSGEHPPENGSEALAFAMSADSNSEFRDAVHLSNTFDVMVNDQDAGWTGDDLTLYWSLSARFPAPFPLPERCHPLQSNPNAMWHPADYINAWFQHKGNALPMTVAKYLEIRHKLYYSTIYDRQSFPRNHPARQSSRTASIPDFAERLVGRMRGPEKRMKPLTFLNTLSFERFEEVAGPTNELEVLKIQMKEDGTCDIPKETLDFLAFFIQMRLPFCG